MPRIAPILRRVMNIPLRQVRPQRRGHGWSASGPGFYVFEEDPRELRQRAEELSRAAPPAHPADPDPTAAAPPGSRGR